MPGGGNKLAVVDASIALSWCFEDEATPATDALLEFVREHGALVPGLWFLEVGNVLLQAEKRGRITATDVDARLNLISELPIMVDQQTVGAAWGAVLELARGESLTSYDACYLELAYRRDLRLFTKNRALMEAAKRIGVAVTP
jgi:predicted nucleic acid-binding protein